MSKMSRRGFLKTLGIGLLAAGGGGTLYGGLVEPNRLEIVEQRIALPGLPAGLSGLRAVQLSDLHMGAWTTRAQLQRAVELALAQKPDLVFITGDYLTDGGDTNRALADLSAALSPLGKQAPVLTVMGNHDHSAGEGDLRALFGELGFQELANMVQPFTRNGDTLHFAGVDSVSTGHQQLGQVVKASPKGVPVVLLAHEPDMAEYSAPTKRFAMQISGHSHGGQVVLPGFGRLILPWMAQKYPAGLYQVGSMIQYTNRGLGMIHVPLRINCLPELTVFTFVPG